MNQNIAKQNSIKVVELLEKQISNKPSFFKLLDECDLNYEVFGKGTPIYFLLSKNSSSGLNLDNKTIINYIHKCDLTFADGLGSNVLMYVIDKQHDEKLNITNSQFMEIVKKSNLKLTDVFLETVLSKMIRHNSFEFNNFNLSKADTSIILKKSNLNKTDRKFYTPLMNLIEYKTDMVNQYSLIDLFITHGSDINYKNKLGETPFTVAVSKQNKKIIKKLIEYGADMNSLRKDTVEPKILEYINQCVADSEKSKILDTVQQSMSKNSIKTL